MSDRKYTDDELQRAQRYWAGLSDHRAWWRHYTTGPGRGLYDNVGPDASFEEFLIESMYQTEFERRNDI